MKEEMFFNSKKVKNHIDLQTGQLINNDIIQSENAALDIGKRLLGCTLITNKKVYIISMLELYYGSIGDDCHDWYKVHYAQNHHGIAEIQVAEQIKKGLRFYSKQQINSPRNRIDIVIGQEGIAVSFLVRNLININGENVGIDITGNPGFMARELFSQNMIDKPDIEFNSEINNQYKIEGHYLFDTNKIFFEYNKITNEDIIMNLRCKNNIFCGLEGMYKNRKWNLSIQNNILIPEEIQGIKK